MKALNRHVLLFWVSCIQQVDVILVWDWNSIPNQICRFHYRRYSFGRFELFENFHPFVWLSLENIKTKNPLRQKSFVADCVALCFLLWNSIEFSSQNAKIKHLCLNYWWIIFTEKLIIKRNNVMTFFSCKTNYNAHC